MRGEVVSIADGDTITILTSGKAQIKVRLAEIDTPERGQPYGTAAKQALADKVFRQQVRVVVDAVDKYGRQVGYVYLGTRNINREMVAEGHAWAYRRYLKDHSLLVIEDQARATGLGLWGLSEARHTPPWRWREQRRMKNYGSSVKKVSDIAEGSEGCDGKRYCREMVSCREAKFYLRQCGVSSLDGDGDGIPCEAICD